MKRRVFLWFLVLVLALAGCARAEDNALSVTFFSVGKADSILLQTRDSTVLIDTATNKSGKHVAQSLLQMGISEIDILIITHFDKDHVGGADTILENFSVKRVLEPAYASDSKQTSQYREAMDGLDIAPETLRENTAFTLDGVDYSIDVANRTDYGEGEENDFSLVVAAQYGDTRFLFAGDAENPRLLELLQEGNLRSNVLKVPHHGKYENASPAFFAAVSPDYAIITSADDDLEDAQTVLALEAVKSKVLLTRVGTVTIVSDGKTLTVTQ